MIERYDGFVVLRSLSQPHRLLGGQVDDATARTGDAARLLYAVTSRSLGAVDTLACDTDPFIDEAALSRQAMAARDFRPVDLGDCRDRILDVLRGRGLRFRASGRWQLPTIQAM